MAQDPMKPGPRSGALVRKWGRLHAGRSALGLSATLIFLWAALR
jgi:hypothetical protein